MRPAPTAAILLAALTAAAPSGCGRELNAGGYRFDHRGSSSERAASATFPADLERVEVANLFGSVRVETTRGEPGWSWNLRCWARSEERAAVLAEAIVLRVGHEETTARLELVLPAPPANELRGVESALTLRLPPAVELDVENSFGPVRIEGLEGEVRARNAHGELELVDLRGRVEGKTSFADLSARNLGARAELRNQHGTLAVRDARGPLDVETSFATLTVDGAEAGLRARNQHGALEARGVRGSADVGTSFARLALAGEPDRVECRNQHGDVRLHLAGTDLGPVNVRSSFGDVRVALNPRLAPYLEARARFGEVRSAFPLERDERRSHTAFASGGDPDAPCSVRVEVEHGDVRFERADG